MIANSEELLELVAAKYDILEIMDTLGWDTEDIVRKLRKDILRNIEKFDDIDF